MALTLCATCARHVRTSDTTCPFCGGLRPAPVPRPTSRSSRAALVFGSATMVVASLACGGSVDTPADASTEAGTDPTVVPPYGLPPPPPDASPRDAAIDDASDAGSDASDAANDGSPAPAYGLPPG